jgi:superfamily II DNA or RNA helicase
MSICTDIENLNGETRQKLNKDLEIKMENKYDMGPPKYIYPFEIKGNEIILPFAYAARNLKLPRPDREDFPPAKVVFNGALRPEQQEIRKEALGRLSKSGSILMSMYTGFGKCLGKDTPILMYDGTIKAVQDVKVGDMLMGDDSTAREVLSLARGQEQMYNIIPTKGESFSCNESHILSFKISGHKVIMWNKSLSSFFVRWVDTEHWSIKSKYFKNKSDAEEFLDTVDIVDTVDIELKEYFTLSESIKHRLKLYRVPVNFPTQDITLDPYFLGLWLGDGHSNRPTITTAGDETREASENGNYGDNTLMNQLQKYNLINNKHIPIDYKVNNRKIRLALLAGLIDSDGYHYKNVYEIVQKNKQLADDIAYVARSLGFASFVKTVTKTCTNNGKSGTYYLVTIYGDGLEHIPVLLPRKKASPRKQTKDALVTGFKAVPIDDKNYYGFVIGGNHRFLLGDFTVTHNTCCSIKLACDVGFQTLVIVNKLVLMKQWDEGIMRFCPDAVVQKLTTKSKKSNADFYVINAQNVEKMGTDFFSNIGTVIIDESHLIMAETLSKSMQYVFPRYLIGLTATPYRVDGLNKLLDLYFGSYKIVRNLWREHTAYKVTTGFKPTIEKAANGRVNWGIVLDSQANDHDRNELIIKLLKYFSDRNFLVLTKRISQGEYLLSRLEEEGEDVTSLLGNNQEFELSSRILIGTSSKVGVGFDHPRLDALLLAADLEQYFIQYLGRVFRTKDVEPIIVDLVDDYSLLNKHFATRQKVYQEHGGTVRNFDLRNIF